MPARKSQFQAWYEIVKKELLVTEPQNILARSECCQNIINECISHMNMNLGLPALSATQQYHCAVQPTDHLKFLLDWPGLRVDNSPKAPKTKKEYEKKSKNWLNGRRAPNYGKTLFPFFIHDAERYVLATSKILVKNDEEKQKLYYDIVIYKVLAQLCGCSVSLHEQAKKAPFFCKNSVERKGRLKEILQSYASDHEYIQGFPSCFEEAIGYFDRKSNQYFHQFRSEYLGYDKNYDDDGDSYLEADDLPPRTRGRGGRGMGMKSSPRDRDRDRYFNKRENRLNQGRQRTGGADAEYWKKQFMNLKRELAKEHQMRIKAERERDNLKNLINTSAANNNMSADIHNIHNGSIGNGSSFGSSNGLPLTNDNSFDSINGSSTTTASTTSSSVCGGNGTTANILGDINLPNNVLGAAHNNMIMNNHINTNMAMPQLQPTNSYQSAQSHSTHHTRSSHSHSSQQSQGMISNMQQMNMANINNPSFQINHMRQQMNGNNNNNAVSNPYGPAIPPIVNNCTNNFNTDMNQLSSLKSNFMLQRSNQIVNNNNSQPMLPTSINQQNNNMNMNMMNNNMMNTNNNGNNLNINSINNIPNLSASKQVQPSLLFQNSANESGFGMPATDAFSTIIDTMPIMNRQQQISDDSYPGFGDNSHHALTSPAPQSMYSSFNNNNAVITNTTDPF